MRKKHFIPFFLLLVLTSIQKAFGQSNPYVKVDSIMRNYHEKVRTEDELYKVVYFIRTHFRADSLRLRASVIWITENIAYDVKSYLEEDPRAGQLNYVIKNKKAVCAGYAYLVKYFCDAFKIESTIINGEARTGERDVYINRPNLKINHSWNAVKINDSWRLIDATWAAGSAGDMQANNMKFIRQFNELYYFTPPERLILNHYPDQYKHQFLTKPIPEIIFKKRPLFTSAFLKEEIQQVYPDTALLRVQKGDTLVIKFKAQDLMPLVCAFRGQFENDVYSAQVTLHNGWNEFHYPVKFTGSYYLYIGFCYFDSLLVYKLEVN